VVFREEKAETYVPYRPFLLFRMEAKQILYQSVGCFNYWFSIEKAAEPDADRLRCNA